jgi:carboxymethylenebutenolidase
VGKSYIRKERSDVMDNESNLGAVFDKHLEYEFERKDVDATMSTMTEEPYVLHVPTLTGGRGYDELYSFYKNHFIGKMPKDFNITSISRTVGKDQVVDELIISFTHDTEFEYMLPGVAHTGKYVEIPHVVVVKFKDNKISHEHIYWDQASVLVQIGVLKPENSITGIEQAKKLVELSKIERRHHP